MLYTIMHYVTIAANLYLLVLIGRLIFDWTALFRPGWRPTGVFLVIANFCFALTDPPLRWLRRYIKPLQFGPVAFDLAFVVLFLLVQFVPRLIYLLLRVAL